LSIEAVWSLDNNVSSINDIEVSSSWQLRDNVEWSFNIESEIFIEFSLLGESFPLVTVDNIPLLVATIMLVPYNNLSVLSILSSVDIKDLSFLINDVSILVSEQLPPSSIGTFRIDLMVSSIALDSQ
jgi:hypothetical protein